MLLSLSQKFIFVANLKTASTAIEAAIGDKADIKIAVTRFGKHDGLSAISQKFSWIKRYVPYEDFFVFGVMREPVDYLLSLYNSHQKSAFDGKQQSTKDMAFDEFLEVWCARSWQAKPQHLRFTDEHKRLRMSYIIDISHLSGEFPEICRRLGLGTVDLGKKNSSPEVLRREDLTSSQIARVRAAYSDDYEFLRNRPRQL